MTFYIYIFIYYIFICYLRNWIYLSITGYCVYLCEITSDTCVQLLQMLKVQKVKIICKYQPFVWCLKGCNPIGRFLICRPSFFPTTVWQICTLEQLYHTIVTIYYWCFFNSSMTFVRASRTNRMTIFLSDIFCFCAYSTHRTTTVQ